MPVGAAVPGGGTGEGDVLAREPERRLVGEGPVLPFRDDAELAPPLPRRRCPQLSVDTSACEEDGMSRDARARAGGGGACARAWARGARHNDPAIVPG